LAELIHHRRKYRLKQPTWIHPPPDEIKRYKALKVYRFTCHHCMSENVHIEHIAWQGIFYNDNLGPVHLIGPKRMLEWETLLKTNFIHDNTGMEVYVGQWTKDACKPADSRV